MSLLAFSIGIAIGAFFMGIGLLQFVAPEVGQLRALDIVDEEIGDGSAGPGERLLAYFLGLILIFGGGFFVWLGINGIRRQLGWL